MPAFGRSAPLRISRSAAIELITACCELNSIASVRPYLPQMSAPRLRFSMASFGVADILARRAHHLRTVERDRILAGLLQHVEQPRALLALGEQPAVFAAERADRNLRRADDVEHLAIRHAPLVAAGEVDAAQLDRVEAAVACGLKRGFERRGVDGPGVQRQASELRHQSVLACMKCERAAPASLRIRSSHSRIAATRMSPRGRPQAGGVAMRQFTRNTPATHTAMPSSASGSRRSPNAA